jgi:hypothetical protein
LEEKQGGREEEVYRCRDGPVVIKGPDTQDEESVEAGSGALSLDAGGVLVGADSDAVDLRGQV